MRQIPGSLCDLLQLSSSCPRLRGRGLGVCAGAAVTTAVPCWGWCHSAMELGLHLVTAIHPLAQVLVRLCRNAELP